MAEEYLYKLGVDVSQFRRDLNAVISDLGKLEDKYPGVAGAVSKATSAFSKYGASAKDGGRAASAAAESATKESKAFQALATNLGTAEKAYQRYLQRKATGVNAKAGGLQNYSTEQLQQFVDTAKARPGTNSGPFVQDAKNEVKARIEAENAKVAAVARSRAEFAAMGEKERADAQKVNDAMSADLTRRLNADRQAIQSNQRMREQAAVAGQRRQQQVDAAAARQQETAARRAVQQQEADQRRLNSQQTAAANQLSGILERRSNQRIATLGPQAAAQAVLHPTEQAAQKMVANQPAVATAQSIAAMRDMTRQMGVLAATEQHEATVRQQSQVSLPRLRYAMYDVSAASRTMGLAFVGAAGAVIGAAAAYDQLFASVKRTSDIDYSNVGGQKQLAALRQDLINLTTSMPVSFADITKIATLGQQLGIGSSEITQFTQVVAQFSATTNVGVEDAATAFGRLRQILHDSDYRGMADSIAYLGVKSVATESEIIAVASQLAVSAHQAHFTTSEVLALADATASLGIRPEAARGSFIRTFGQITAAVNRGGKALNDLSSISGLSSEKFAADWKGGKASDVFVSFLKGLNNASGGTKANLAALGITAARDNQTLGLLAQNTDVLTTALGQVDSKARNNYLGGAYAVQVDNLNDKMATLGNQFTAFLAGLGSSSQGPLNALVSGLTGVLRAAEALTKNPLTAWTSLAAIGIVALTGIVLLAVSAAGRFAANLIALRQVIDTVNETGLGLRGTFTQIIAGTNGAANATAVYTAEMQKAITLQEAYAQATAQAAASEGTLSAEASALIAAYEGLTAAQAGVLAAEEALNVARATEEVEDGALAGAVAGLTAAREAETVATAGAAAALDAYKVASVGTVNPTGAVISASSKFSTVLGRAGLLGALLAIGFSLPSLIQGFTDWADEMNGDTTSVESLTKALLDMNDAKNAGAAKSKIAGVLPGGKGNENFSYNDAKGRKVTTNGVQAEVNDILHGNRTPGGSVGLFQGGGRLNATADLTAKQIDTVDKSLTALLQKGDKASMAGFTRGLDAYRKSMKDAGVKTHEADAALVGVNGQLKTTAGSNLRAAAAAKAAGDAAGAQGDTLATTLQQEFGASIAAQALSKDLGSLGEAYVKQGRTAAFSGTAMTAVIQDIYDSAGSTSEAASKMLGLADALEKAGYGTAKTLGLLRATAADIDPTATAAAFSLSTFINGMNKAQKQADKTTDAVAKQVRTLVDYGNDLDGVFNRDFEIRFGNQDAQDALTTKLHDMKQAAKDASAKIKELHADIQKLRADMAVNRYHLSVAVEYGDSLRAGEIRADLAQQQSDLTAKNKDLTKAQDDASGALKGNSDAAIANRNSMEELVKAGAAVLISMAKNGASQGELKRKAAELKRGIEEQARTFGMKKKDVEGYTSAFDDMARIIGKVPRKVDVDVTANTDPATLALAEFDAKAKEQGKKHYSAGTFDPIKTPDSTKPLRKKVLMDKIAALSSELADQAAHGNYRGGIDVQIQRLQAKLNSGNYRSGGYTGNVPPWEVAGVVHGREFVLNEVGTRMIPRQVLEAANQGRAPIMPTINVASAAPNVSSVSLGRTERQLLAAAAAPKPAVFSATQFGRAVDGSYVTANRRGAN